MRFAEPAQSWAVLFGAHSYKHPHLSALPAVANNLRDFCDVLTDPGLGGLHPEQCVVIADPPELPAVGLELARIASQAEDTLIIYYAGHGLLDDTGALFLALPESNPDHPMYTALPLTWIRRAFAATQARRRILILDCCFSGRAIEAMTSPSALVSGQIEIAGAYTLTCAPANEPANAPVGAHHTAFTGELLNVLRKGIDNDSDGLSLGDIFLELKRAHFARGLPAPQQRNTSTVGHLALVRNNAYLRTVLPSAADPAPADPLGMRPSAITSAASTAQAVGAAITSYPASAPPWVAGLAAWRAGDLDDASRLLMHAIKSSADNRARSAASIALGMLHRDGYRDLATAEALLASAADCDDARLIALSLLHHGCVLELKGDTTTAESQYRQVMDTSEADCVAFAAARLGWLLKDRGLTTAAEEVFRAGYASAASPARVWPALGLADALSRSGRADEGADIYEQVLASQDATAKAFAALGLRQILMEHGLMAEAEDCARSVADNPSATRLWPAVLADEVPATPESRIYAISKWLTWFRSTGGEAVRLADKKSYQFIVFEEPGKLTMSVCVMPRALPQKLRFWYPREISPRLSEIGFKMQQPGSRQAESFDFWVMDAEAENDDKLAELSDNLLTESLVGRQDFTLHVEPEPAIEVEPQPRPPMPDLTPPHSAAATTGPEPITPRAAIGVAGVRANSQQTR